MSYALKLYSYTDLKIDQLTFDVLSLSVLRACSSKTEGDVQRLNLTHEYHFVVWDKKSR